VNKNLFELLLGSQLVGMSTPTFPAVGSPRREASVTFAANHLFAVVLGGEGFQ
jgi:hypothetical protein